MIMDFCRFNLAILFGVILGLVTSTHGLVSQFRPSGSRPRSSVHVARHMVGDEHDHGRQLGVQHLYVAQKSALVAGAIAALVLGSSAFPALADEYGRESEAPTMVTGETVMICIKRGPLGACTKTALRTDENENDMAKKYFQEPTELVKRKDNQARTAEKTEGNALIERLKQQTEDNREKNELLVKQRTMVNDSVSACRGHRLSVLRDFFALAFYRSSNFSTFFASLICTHQSASFGPFDGQVLILNVDGKGFTLLANPQAMRLKKAGLIADKRFIRQPTQEELDTALEPGPSLLDRILGDKQ